MSLQRYAIIAAVSQQQQHKQQQQQQQLQHPLPHNATVMSTSTSTTATATTAPSATTMDLKSLTVSEDELLQSQELASSSSITTYYNGGMGLYNQQRGIGGGISLLNGVAGSAGSGHSSSAGGSGSQTYAHVVNGSVNLLLGGSMLCLVTTILCVVCYCCHRNIKKRTEAAYRQQQHHWLENDPNMEIYSVEQCYETSGLFLGDSTDGLTTLPTLHHEPPPSYDAVVLHEQQLLQQQQQHLEEQQLQLQQQQLLLQRVSPPPGYRSTLDIGSADGLAASSSCSSSAAVNAGEVLANKQLQRTLNAQSCCSLQRAEVENMWNAAAAAVAARNGNCLELDTYLTTTSSTSSPPPPLPPALQARKQAQSALRLNTFGRRYLQYSQQHQQHQQQQQQQHSHYNSGCPLCGKFRYAPEEEALTASLESGLEHFDANDNVASVEEQLQQQQLQQQQQENQQQQQQQQQPLAATDSCNQIDSRIDDDADTANGNTPDNTIAATSATDADVGTDENDNATAAATAATTEVATVLDMSNINENGIISLDMSKIIDVSGLPTYEGALKLESSGYV
ncbi:GATA zinc finger domain-containing protein 10 [Drosophila grimshawi]|uniref:GATA zinc finger domain-containing protein 10 n=1 Tax=Drosophila grimshawi TaxID=7222 RepID=UPI0013EF1C88|nr:GATA zinc finger domain-containing protein 10 [Drosophila grimshawi]